MEKPRFCSVDFFAAQAEFFKNGFCAISSEKNRIRSKWFGSFARSAYVSINIHSINVMSALASGFKVSLTVTLRFCFIPRTI